MTVLDFWFSLPIRTNSGVDGAKNQRVGPQSQDTLRFFSNEVSPPNLRSSRGAVVSLFDVGMTWNDLRLILLTLGVVVALYAKLFGNAS
jgi:hypothetical protein